MTDVQQFSCTVNGLQVSTAVDTRTSAADFLRQELGLTGTHVSCEQGVCGSCTILVDDAAVRSCLLLAMQLHGAVVETVESLGGLDELSTLQQTFSAEHGLQCGFCTPGILMTVEAAKRAGTSAVAVVDELLPGHLCRCTGYDNIRKAVQVYLSPEA